MLVCFVGYPLSGKSTVARSYAKRFGASYFSTGDLVRRLLADAYEFPEWDLSRRFNDDVNKSVLEWITVLTDDSDLVIDGYPRSEEQIRLIEPFDPLILFFIVNPVIMYSRMKRRGRVGDNHKTVVHRCQAAVNLLTSLNQSKLETRIIHTDDKKVVDLEREIDETIDREIDRMVSGVREEDPISGS